MNAGDRPVKNISADLAQLQTVAQKLSSEINQLHHELRRVRDGLERAGGSGHELEKSARQLSENIRLCEQELKHNQERQAGCSTE
jgi:chromosome segregation ATPase